MSATINELVQAYRSLLQSDAPLTISRELLGTASGSTNAGQGMSAERETGNAAEGVDTAGTGNKPDAVALKELSGQFLGTQLDGGVLNSPAASAPIPGLAVPAKSQSYLPFSNLMAQILNGLATPAREPSQKPSVASINSSREALPQQAAGLSQATDSASLPGRETFSALDRIVAALMDLEPKDRGQLPGADVPDLDDAGHSVRQSDGKKAPVFPDTAANPGNKQHLAETSLGATGRKGMPTPEVSLSDSGQLEDVYQLLEKAGEGVEEDVSLMSLVVLNAAMIPGWPYNTLSTLRSEKTLPQAVKQIQQGGLTDEEIIEYLAKYGLSPTLLETLEKQAPLDPVTRKIMMWLVSIVTVVGAIMETLRREAEEFDLEDLKNTLGSRVTCTVSSGGETATSGTESVGKPARNRIFLD